MSDALKYVQMQAVTLAGAGCVIGDTAIILNSLKTIDSVQLTMTDFGTEAFGTLEPDNNTQEEQITFTGISVNANGTVSLTGVKNVGWIAPYTQTSGVLKTHPGGAKFIISNTSGFYDRLTSKDDDETITGDWTVPTPATSQSIANKAYVDGVALLGSAKATTSVFGVSVLSVAPVTASNPIVVGDNDTRVPPVNTSTVTAGMVSALAGTSGTPGASNAYVTAITGSPGLVASAWVIRDSTMQIKGTTPVVAADVANKGYVDNVAPVIYKNGTATLTNSTTTQNVAHGLGKIPKFIRVTSMGGTSGVGCCKNIGVYNGTTTSAVYVVTSGSSGWTASAGVATNIITANDGNNNADSLVATVTFDVTNIILSITKAGGGCTTVFTWEAFA